jgi:hypothetical protein
MSEHKIELRNIKFSFRVNGEPVTVDFNVVSKTIVVFSGVTVYTSNKNCYKSSDAETVLWEYIESIQFSNKKGG